MEDTLSRKRKAVQLDLLKQDMVGELLQITPKPKKLKTTARLIDDVSSGNLCLEVAHPTTQKEVTQASTNDLDIDRINLGSPIGDRDVHNFQVLATRMVKRSKKDKESKEKSKAS